MRYSLVSLLICFLFSAHAEEYVSTIYGDCVVTEPVLCDLLNSQAFRRLQGVHQYGTVHYIHKSLIPYNRRIHSEGVFWFLQKYGAPLLEQIAGLLHDTSHTVFSHVGDHLFTNAQNFNQNKNAYQDEKHLWILSQTDIPEILAKYGIQLAEIDHKSGNFPLLEQDLPDLCADRIEYVLYGGYAEGWLTTEEVHTIVACLKYEQGRWYFTDVDAAKKFATISIRLCREIFGSYFNIAAYTATAQALHRAMHIGLITFQDILFGQDDNVFLLLRSNEDKVLKGLVHKILHAKELYQPSNASNYVLTFIAKFRGTNPWVLTPKGFNRLTDLNTAFDDYYQQVRREMSQKRYYKEISLTTEKNI